MMRKYRFWKEENYTNLVKNEKHWSCFLCHMEPKVRFPFWHWLRWHRRDEERMSGYDPCWNCEYHPTEDCDEGCIKLKEMKTDG